MTIKKQQIFLYFFSFLILGLFFYLYNYLNIQNNNKQLIFNSPDETINYYFSSNFADNSNFKKPIGYLSYAEDAIPRSVKTSNSSIMPIGFIGLTMIYGTIAKIIGKFIIIYLTPIFSIIGVLFFFFLTRELFGKQNAIISSLLLLMFPGYWYFSAKSMMPNVLLCCFLIISLYFFIKALRNKKTIYYILSPLFLALTLSIRTSEAVWIGFLFLTTLIYYKQNINWKKLILVLIVFIISIMPLLYFNNQNQGSVILPGYYETIKTQTQNSQNPYLSIVKKIILPFGFHPRNTLFVIKNYIIKLIPIYFILLLLCSTIYLFIKKDKTQKLYFYLWIIISIYLLCYYGSWIFNDNPTGNHTIGSSYIRYFLPIFIFGIPIISSMFEKVFNKNLIGKIFIISIISIIFLDSYYVVMSKDAEGLKNIKTVISNNRARLANIINNTDENSLIFTDKADKYIFPYRNTVYLNSDITNFKNLNNFRNKNINLYYLTPKINKEELDKLKIQTDEIFNDSDYTLYKLNFVNEK